MLFRTTDEATAYCKAHARDYLNTWKANDGRTWVCPECGNGTGSKGVGVDFIPGNTSQQLKCHSCGWHGDIIDFIGAHEARAPKGSAAAFKAAYDWFGCEIEGQDGAIRPTRSTAMQDFKGIGASPPQITTPRPSLPAREAKDYTERLVKAAQRLSESPEAIAYLTSRGIGIETARRFGVGFEPHCAQKGRDGLYYGVPSILVPLHSGGFVARRIRDLTLEEELVGVSPKYHRGEKMLFNRRALLESEKPVFVCEGVFDALAFEEIGFPAVATGGGLTNSQKTWLEEHPVSAPAVILWPDNDAAGREQAEHLAEVLSALHVPFINADGWADELDVKDANALLQLDKEHFARLAELETAKAWDKAGAESVLRAEFNAAQYMREQLDADIQNFRRFANRKTGFPNLDAALNAIVPGLYVVGAVSSLGKTTFVHQLCDQMAAQGEHVLFFSLEMSQMEMVTKSLSREISIANNTAREIDKGTAHRVTSLDIRLGRLSKADQLCFDAAKEVYFSKVGNRMNIIPGHFDVSIDRIERYVREYAARYRCSPIVVVDYLQIVPYPQGVADRREAIDQIVKRLSQLSKSVNCTVFVVTAFNRDSYNSPVSLSSAKESGGIEYSADCFIGLQPYSVGREELFETGIKKGAMDKAFQSEQRKEPREIEVKVLKNRVGRVGVSAGFRYYPSIDLFVPDGDFERSQAEYDAARARQQSRERGESPEKPWDSGLAFFPGAEYIADARVQSRSSGRELILKAGKSPKILARGDYNMGVVVYDPSFEDAGGRIPEAASKNKDGALEYRHTQAATTPAWVPRPSELRGVDEVQLYGDHEADGLTMDDSR